MSLGRTVVVLGEGVGGVVSAVEARRRLGHEHRVVLVEREERHLLAQEWLWRWL